MGPVGRDPVGKDTVHRLAAIVSLFAELVNASPKEPTRLLSGISNVARQLDLDNKQCTNSRGRRISRAR